MNILSYTMVFGNDPLEKLFSPLISSSRSSQLTALVESLFIPFPKKTVFFIFNLTKNKALFQGDCTSSELLGASSLEIHRNTRYLSL
ncbi:hypothetical protein D3C81_1310040 [compost metagenome]